MDPITALQTVSAAAEVAVVVLKTCQKLYEFTNEVRHIDRTLGRAEDEVRDLERVLGFVTIGLKDPSVARAVRSQAGQEILRAVCTSVERAQHVLSRVDSILQIIMGDSAETGAVNKLRQAVRSKRKARDLDECIVQVDKSKQNLNIALTMIGVHIIANHPANRKAGTVEEIVPLTKQLEVALEESKTARTQPEDRTIRRAAVSVLERAKSPPPVGERLSRSSTLVEAQDESAIADDTNEDVHGTAKRWAELLGSSRQSARTSRRGSLVQKMKGIQLDDSDSDGEPALYVEPPNERFQIRTVKKAIEAGTKNYEAGNHQQAAAQFGTVLAGAAELSAAARMFIDRDIINVRLNIADIYATSQDHLKVAEEYLLQAILAINEDKRSSDAEMQEQLCKAYFTLARIYFLERDYNEAQSYCKDAVNGHIEMGSENTKPYYDAIHLLVLVYHAEGNDVLVNLHINELPHELRDHTWREIQSGHNPHTRRGSATGNSPQQRVTQGHKHRLSDARHFSIATVTEGPPLMAKVVPVSPTTNVETSPMVPTDSWGEAHEMTRRPTTDTITTTREQNDGIAELAAADFQGDFDADKALTWAIKEDKKHIVHALLTPPGIQVMRKRHFASPKPIYKQARINGTKREVPPLMTAVMTPGRVMLVKLLLARGADKNVRDAAGHSVLEVAATHGQQEVINVLLDHGLTLHSSDGTRAFHAAAANGQLNVLQLLMSRGLRPDIREDDFGQQRPAEQLQRNVSNGSTGTTGSGSGTTVGGVGRPATGPATAARTDYGRTALNWAAWRGHAACVEFLIRNGADPNLGDRGGSTPLMAAVRERHLECAATLLHYFADANLTNDRDQSALIIAAEQGLLPAAKMILDTDGVQLDRRDGLGWTALMWASERRHVAIVRLLLERGAGANARCNQGSTALDQARGSAEVTALLKAFGAQRGTGIARSRRADNDWHGYVLV